MDWIISAIVAWFAASPWERLLLCAETFAIVVGGPLVFWHRLGLKGRVRNLQELTGSLRGEIAELREQNSRLNQKADQLIELMKSMVGKSEEEQGKIVRLAANMQIQGLGSASFESGTGGQTDANRQEPRGD